MTDEIKADVGGGRQISVPVNYPGNSKTVGSPQTPPDLKEKAKIQPVVKGAVIQKKKGLMHRIKGALISGEGDTVWQFVAMEVLIPAAKNMVSDAVSQGIERLLFGDLRPRSYRDRPAGYTSYNTVRRQQRTPEYGVISPRARSQHDFDDIILASRGEAEQVIDRLRELVDQYDVATVADLFDLVGITGNYADEKWGWYDLRPAGVRPVRGGYLISLPRTQPID